MGKTPSTLNKRLFYAEESTETSVTIYANDRYL
nr:MAG TPA: hypothetical protein [Caudoviricetes sp.]